MPICSAMEKYLLTTIAQLSRCAREEYHIYWLWNHIESQSAKPNNIILGFCSLLSECFNNISFISQDDSFSYKE